MKINFVPFDEKYINELVRIHRNSFKEHFNSKLGNNYATKLLRWFANDSEFESIFLIAVDEESDSLIGYMCGAIDGFQSKMNRDLTTTILKSFLLRPYLFFYPQFWKLFRSKIRAFKGKAEYPEYLEYEQQLPKPIYSVNAFALEPSYREKGFGVFLLDIFFNKFFEEVKRLKLKTISATIRIENKPIYTYYKMRKWLSAPVVTNSGTLNFYKVIE